jgi:hypothetical protein
MKASLEFPRLLDLMCLALCHWDQAGNPRRIRSSHWLLELKFSNWGPIEETRYESMRGGHRKIRKEGGNCIRSLMKVVRFHGIRFAHTQKLMKESSRLYLLLKVSTAILHQW